MTRQEVTGRLGGEDRVRGSGKRIVESVTMMGECSNVSDDHAR